MADKFIFGLLLMVFLSSCSFLKEKPAMREDGADAISLEAEAAPAIPTIEAVFTYGSPSKMVLVMGGDPVLLPGGYVRLIGVVGGERPTACLEIGGRGLALGVGEIVNGYRLKAILGRRVVLCK